ncbi:hypothetical protein [Vagococcus sp. WN89Y]|uniref:hypothetical protein n=1 Tax=Vagococcus sp. WN89Y TaxID=3457258 RepID=UPI003FCE02C6
MDISQIAYGIADSLSSLPRGFGLGVVRTWEGTGIGDRREKYRNEEENERFFRMIKGMGNPETPLRRLITIIINDFYQKLGPKGKEVIENKLLYGGGAIAGKVGGQIAIAQTGAAIIIRKVVAEKVYRHFIRFTSSASLNIIMIQGLIEEAARASRRMSREYPFMYMKVQREDLDMIYFFSRKRDGTLPDVY